MLSDASTLRRASRWSAIARAWRLVSLDENLQPVLPVQATIPARTEDASALRPIAARASAAAARSATAMSDTIRFCHGVRRIVPLPWRLAMPAIERILQARTLAVGAIAFVDEDPHDRHSHRNALLGRDEHPEVAGEIAMPRDPADRDAKVHALRHRLAGSDAHGGETDVVGVFQGGYAAATVEGDVEFARQSVELAVVEDRVIQI